MLTLLVPMNIATRLNRRGLDWKELIRCGAQGLRFPTARVRRSR